jgi:hypothetical protein
MGMGTEDSGKSTALLQWWDCERFPHANVLCLVFFFFNPVEHWSLSRQTQTGSFRERFLSDTPRLLLLRL